jgi:hypothetical protein
MGPTITRRERAADSPLIERITQVAYEERTEEWVTPDGCWDIVIFQKPAGTMVSQTGPEALLILWKTLVDRTPHVTPRSSFVSDSSHIRPKAH